MPDISMCDGTRCVVKEECYRFKATPSPFLQSYFANSPVDLLTQQCEYFWPLTKDSNFKRGMLISRWKPELK